MPGYAPRTIYRYSGKLAELEVVDREEEPGVPSKVVHTLSDPCGTELYNLVNRFADASMTRLPDGRIDAHAWAALGLLADLWEAEWSRTSAANRGRQSSCRGDRMASATTR